MPTERVEPTTNFVINSEALKEIIDRCSAAQRRVIGFYRSHLGNRVCLRQEDLALIEQWFQDPSNVFLVIRPHEGRASAGFFYWQNGSVFGDFTLMFPFSAAELQSRSWNSLLGGSEKSGWFRTLLTRSTEGTVKMGRSRKWVLIYCLLTLFLTIAIASTWTRLGSSSRSGASSRDPSHALGLRVQRNGMHVLVTWDLSAPQIAKATDANLLIWDGPSQPSYIPLSSKELRTGSMSCTTINDKVSIRLEVLGASGNAITDSVVLRSEPELNSPAVEAAEYPASTNLKS